MKVFKCWFPVIAVLLLSPVILTGCGGSGGRDAPTSIPTAPTGVSATPGDRKATISWAAVPGATSYNVYWSDAAGVTPLNGVRVTGASDPYIQTGIPNGATYYSVVTAVNSLGESAASPQVSCRPALPAPTGVTATKGDNKATISWISVPGATSYNIYWSTATGVTPANGIQITGATNPYVQTGRTNGTAYYYVVTAVFTTGESAASTEASAVPSVTPPPAAPTAVTATPGDGRATISWTAVPGATSYNIRWTTATTNGTITGATDPYIQTGLVNATAYTYWVFALNDNGQSAPSTPVGTTPFGISFTTAIISDKTFSYTDTEGNSGTVKFNANGNVSNPVAIIGTWSINASGQLVLVSTITPGNVDRITLTNNSGVVITASDVRTNAITPSNNTTQILTLTAVFTNQMLAGHTAAVTITKGPTTMIFSATGNSVIGNGVSGTWSIDPSGTLTVAFPTDSIAFTIASGSGNSLNVNYIHAATPALVEGPATMTIP